MAEEVGKLNKEAADARERSDRLEKENLALRVKLRLTGTRHSLLKEPSSQRLFDQLKRFRGQKVEVGHCAQSTPEMISTANRVLMLLGARGWITYTSKPDVACIQGITVAVRQDAPEKVRVAANELGKAIRVLGLGDPSPDNFIVAVIASGWAPTSADSILLFVMDHP